MALDSDLPSKIRLLGFWWLPGTEPVVKVPGILTFSPESGGSLELIGGFDRALSGDLHGYPRVLGEAEHQYVTLLDCWTQSRHIRSGAEAPREVVGVSRGVIGILFRDPEEPVEFDRCRIHLRHLNQWSQLSGLSMDDGHCKGSGDPERTYATITAEWIDAITGFDGSGWELSITQRLQPIRDMNHRMAVDQEIVLELKSPTLSSPQQFIDVISDFQDLVTIGTGRPAQIDTLVFEHPVARVQFTSGDIHPTAREPLQFFARWNAVDKGSEPTHWAILFFSLEDLGGMPGVLRWQQTAAKYRTELGRVMSIRYRSGLSYSDRIINLTAALESFDHRRAPSKIQNLRVRLRRLLVLSDPFFTPGMLAANHIDQWLDTVINHRDSAAHHRGHVTTYTATQQHFIAESLFWLFVISMLTLSDAPDSVFNRILKHNDIYWLREGLQAAFGQHTTLDTDASGPNSIL